MSTPTGILFSNPLAQPLSTVGQPQAGAYYLFFLTGTLTPANVYYDGALTTPLSQTPGASQPSCTANASGIFNAIYLAPSTTYRVQLYNSVGSKLQDVDPYIPPGIGSQSNIGLILYPQTAAESSAGVTPTNYVYPPGNVLRYGADSTGVSDSTTAFSSAGSIGTLVYAPAGTYKVSSGITITGGGLIGDGSYQTYIKTTDTGSNNVFSYTGAYAGRFENFSLQPATTKSGGYGVVVGPASGEVSGMRFFQVIFNGMPSAIHFVAASLWTVIACNFYNYTVVAIYVDNTNNADSGDSAISGCVFNSSTTTAYSIEQVESGGLKITGNKFNNAGVHVLLNLGATSTSDLIITGNSFENAYSSAIQLQRQAGKSSTFENVVITGNQFLLNSSANVSAGIDCDVTAATFLVGLVIAGNQFRIDDTGASAAIILDYVTNFSVTGNDILGSGGSSIGIDIGTHNVASQLGINRVSGCETNKTIPAAYPTIDPISEAGWGTPSGGSVQANFAAGSGQTMAVISAAVAQIIADLIAVGIYRS